jgi:hypothetical protein
VTKEDVENVLSAIETAYQNNEIDGDHYLHYRAILLFSAFAGQRPQATTARLTVGQFRTAISQKKSVIDVLPEQDKIRMQHIVLFIRRWLTLPSRFLMAGETMNLCSNNCHSNGG